MTKNTGYTSCACRDCMEIAIGVSGEAFCHECEEAGCEHDEECQADGAYGCEEAPDEPDYDDSEDEEPDYDDHNFCNAAY